MTDQRCSSCRYAGEYSRNETMKSGTGWLSCRRYAPRGPVLDHSNATGIDFFPPVRPDLWCGEFSPREAA